MSDIALVGLANAVDVAMRRVPRSGRFGERKVFVSAVWQALPDALRDRLTFPAFKAQLFAAHRAQLLSLARADLVAAMPTATVAASEIEPDRGVTFHFVVDASCAGF